MEVEGRRERDGLDEAMSGPQSDKEDEPGPHDAAALASGQGQAEKDANGADGV